jgi:hypothetical protein
MASGWDTGGRRPRALVVACHLRPSRDKRRSDYLMQPIAGLQVASLIDRGKVDVELYHEDWHGPFDLAKAEGYDIVFLSGLQVDFDRMRQLSWAFRRAGAITVGGGSICTSFPDFAANFFDVVCAGSVDSVPRVIADFLAGSLRPRYDAPMTTMLPHVVDYGLLTEAGIKPPFLLVEATRGCSFKCSFCVMPSEVGGHAAHRLADVTASIERAIDASPRLSLARLWPMVLFLDNNLADDRAFLLSLVGWMKANPRIKGWAALVTQNIVADRALMQQLADGKCVGLFVGIESLDPEMLKRFHKKQNLSKRFNVLDDVAHAESLGIGIAYGMLFDPRHQTADAMRRQLQAVAADPLMPMPVYISFVAPLLGTQGFWQDVAAGELSPGLRLRDLDGETICYTRFADDPDTVTAFGEQVFRRPWEIIGTRQILLKTWRRIVRAGSLNPIRWFVIASANLHCYLWSKGTPAANRTYRAGTDVLDPQYSECPSDISPEDRARYWDPVVVIDDRGQPAQWLNKAAPLARPRQAEAAE